MKTLQFHHKDFLTAKLPDGTDQGFYRQAPHPKESSATGKWMPCDGLAPCLNKSIPVTPETRRYWFHSEDNVPPGYGNKQIFDTARELDSRHLPEGEKTTNIREINTHLGTEEALGLNDTIESLDLNTKENRGYTLQEQTDRNLARHQAKTQEERKPQKKNFLQKLLALVVEIGKNRIIGNNRPLVPARVVLAILVLQPLLALSNLRADDPTAKALNAAVKVEEAYGRLKQMDGAQIKALLQAIPEKDRLELVELLPSKVFPPLLPRSLAARTVNVVPDNEMKKGFDKITADEFKKATEGIPEQTKKKLFDLLMKAVAAATPTKEINLEMA